MIVVLCSYKKNFIYMLIRSLINNFYGLIVVFDHTKPKKKSLNLRNIYFILLILIYVTILYSFGI